MKGFFATIGLCAATLLCTVLYYEGLHLPFIGQLINGAIAHRQEALVQSYERQAAAAVAEEAKRQKAAARTATETLNAQLTTAKAADAKTASDLEQRIASYEQQLAAAHRDCLADNADVDFILHDNQPAPDSLGHH